MSALSDDLRGVGIAPAPAAFLGETVSSAITAAAGGGQANATQLTSTLNIVTVVATAADSVKLPLISTWPNNQRLVVANQDAADSLNIFPATGDSINGLSANTQVACAAGKIRIFWKVSNTAWISMLGA